MKCRGRFGINHLTVHLRQQLGMPEFFFHEFNVGQATLNQIGGATAAHPEVLGQFGVGPVVIQIEPAGVALAIGQNRAVDVEEALAVGTGFRRCIGQNLDTLAARREFPRFDPQLPKQFGFPGWPGSLLFPVCVPSKLTVQVCAPCLKTAVIMPW